MKAPKPPKKKSRRALLKSAGAAALALTLPRMVHAEPLMPRHQEHSHWDTLLEHVGANRPQGDARLRSWIAGIVHEPEVRMKGVVLHGPPGSGRCSFTRAVGGLLVSDGYVVTHERAMFEYAYLGARSVAWESPILGLVADEAAIVHCLTRQTERPTHFMRCESLGGFKVSNATHPNRFHWLEYDDVNPKRLVQFFETFRLNKLDKRLAWGDLRRYLLDEKEAFVESLRERRVRHPSMYLKGLPCSHRRPQYEFN